MSHSGSTSSGKSVLDQDVNSNNSKLEPAPAAFWLVLVAACCFALPLAIAAFSFGPALTGRLQPWVVPLGFAGVAMVAVLWIATFDRAPPQEGLAHDCVTVRPVGMRAITAVLAAIVVLAFGTRVLGLGLTVASASIIVAMGARGVTLPRALMIGGALAIALSLLFAGLLRQPLPILPPGLFR
ncbi:MAG: hypothetical protein ACRDBH_02590 [Bosea sp. (in: a-proteobacteria)]